MHTSRRKNSAVGARVEVGTGGAGPVARYGATSGPSVEKIVDDASAAATWQMMTQLLFVAGPLLAALYFGAYKIREERLPTVVQWLVAERRQLQAMSSDCALDRTICDNVPAAAGTSAGSSSAEVGPPTSERPPSTPTGAPAKSPPQPRQKCGAAFSECLGARVDAQLALELGTKSDATSVARAQLIKRSLARDLAINSYKGIDKSATDFESETERELRTLVLKDMLVTAFVAGFIAFFFVVDIVRAWWSVRDEAQFNEEGTTRERTKRQPGQAKTFATLSDEFHFHRDRNTLRMRFPIFQRAALFFLVAVGMTYVQSPIGIHATMLTTWMTGHPLPGHDTGPAFIDEMAHANAGTIGFLGFLCYVAVTTMYRSSIRDLSDRLLVAFVQRGLVVVVLSIIIGTATDDSSAWRAIVFVAGIFPQTGIDALAKVAQVKLSTSIADRSTGFELMPELDLQKQSILRELGINDAHDLASCDLHWVVINCGIEVGVLLRATDRAILLHYLGASVVERLQGLAISTATEFVKICRDDASAVALARLITDGREDAAGRLAVQLEELRNDDNFQLLQKWHAKGAPTGAVAVVEVASQSPNDVY